MSLPLYISIINEGFLGSVNGKNPPAKWGRNEGKFWSKNIINAVWIFECMYEDNIRLLQLWYEKFENNFLLYILIAEKITVEIVFVYMT